MFAPILDNSKDCLNLSFKNNFENVNLIFEKNNETQSEAINDLQTTTDSIKEISFLQELNKKTFNFVSNLIKNKAAIIFQSLFQFNKIDKLFIDNMTDLEINDNEQKKFGYKRNFV